MAPVDDPLSAARERVVALRASLEGTEDRPVRLAPADAPLSKTERAAAIVVYAAQPVHPAHPAPPAALAALAAQWLAAAVTLASSAHPALPGAP